MDELDTMPITLLDRRPGLAIAALILVPILIRLPAPLFGLGTDPIWTNSLAIIDSHPGILAGSPFGDPNVGWTTEALGGLAAHDWLCGILPWWNPYVGIGLPLAGEMQPAALFLPFSLLLALPHGVFWLELAMQILAALAAYALARQLAFDRAIALTCGLLYALSGTFAETPDEIVLNVMPFLPLLLLGIELARHPGRGFPATLAIALAIGFSVLAGFPEEAYINGLLAFLWALVRLGSAENRAAYLARIAAGGILGLAIAAPQLVAFFDFATEGNVFAAHRFGAVARPVQGLAGIILPFVYGPFGQVFGREVLVRITFGIGGYLGLPLLFAAMLGSIVAVKTPKRRALGFLLAFWIVLSLARSFGFPPAMALLRAVPLLDYVQFYRFSPASWELAAILLAGFALEAQHQDRRALIATLATTSALALLAARLAWPWSKFWNWSEPPTIVLIAFALSLVLEFFLLLALFTILRSDGTKSRGRAAAVLVLNAAILFIVPELSAYRPGRIDKAAITVLRDNIGLGRAYTLGPIVPNYAAYFRVPMLNENMLPDSAIWLSYVQTHLLPPVPGKHLTMFWAPLSAPSLSYAVTAFDRHIDAYRALGVRLLIAPAGPAIALPQGVEKIYTDSLMTIWLVHGAKPFYSTAPGSCRLSNETFRSVTADCAAPSSLTRLEFFDPGWHATINGQAVEITPAHDILQRIALPPGVSIVRFRFAPPHIAIAWLLFFLAWIVLLAAAIRHYAAKTSSSGNASSCRARQVSRT